MPANPIPAGRQHLYAGLAANSTLTDTYNAFIYPKWNEEGTDYPMVFLSRASSNIITPVGTDDIDDDSLTDINIVGNRRQKLEDMDGMLAAVLSTVHHTRGSNDFGSVSSCKVENIWDMPYQVEDDSYPRYIVRVRMYAAGN